MRCKKFKDQTILYLYGELTEGEKTVFEEHIDTCDSCREEMVYTKSVFEAIDETKPVEIPEGDWDKNWAVVKNNIVRTQRHRISRPALPRWAYAAAATALIFLLGLFAGRMWFTPSDAPDFTAMQQGSLQTAFDHYIDDIKPLLLEYANYAEPETDGSAVMVDREFLRGLLIQNVLLKQILADKDPEAAQLLDDIELVLRELENLESDDVRTPALIKELIQKREILFKMEILQKT